jgi:outer membrane protein OmpA-like peptidoglycan-associated protein
MNERATAQQDALAPALTPVGGGILQRRCACGGTPGPTGECAGCRKKRLGLQRKVASRAATPSIPPIVHDVLRSPGQPLDAQARTFMEPRFGHDFGRVSNVAPAMSSSVVSHPEDESEREADRVADAVLDAPPESGIGYDFGQVRVHTDAKAEESARALGADAFTFERHIVFGAGRYAPSTREGRHLLAHELTHHVQQQTTGQQIQRRLTVDPNHPGPSIAPASDPAASLTSSQRFTMMDTLIQSLCDGFEVDAAGDVVTKTLASPDRSALAAGSKPTGCCCLAVLTDALDTWTIEVSQVAGPHTRSASKQVILSPTSTPVEFGSFTPAGSLAFQGDVPAAGHELCGHAALIELSAHPPSTSRLTTNVHDPTVRTENLISTEQGVPAAGLRGLAASGTHRGESVDRITIRQYPLNGTTASSLPTAERDKLRFAADYVVQNESWVDVLGHSDSAGSSSAKKTVSEERANNAKTDLMAHGVLATITKHGLTGVPRFTRVEGLSDTQPPPPPLDADPGNWRRVELLIAGFPAGAQVPPPGTPTTVTPLATPPAVPGLKASADPCVALLTRGAYP